MKTTHLPTGCRYCFQKLDELVKNGNCSYPVGEKITQHSARRTVPAGKNSSIIRHNVTCATLLLTYSAMKVMKQDSSFSYFVFLYFQSLRRDRA